MTTARATVDRIVADLSDRGGLGNEWDQIGADIKDEIRDEWRSIVESALLAERRRVIEDRWQPVETAVKDQYALICDARSEIWLAAYYPENNGANWRGPNSEVYDDVIGWMPLPKPLASPREETTDG